MGTIIKDDKENILGIIGTITGVAGLVVAVIVAMWQAKVLVRERVRNDRAERLAFLTDRIFDVSIPRELRLPFYEEYISKKSNGTAVRFWLPEGSRGNGFRF